ncbi:MAG: hypothetical protein D6705_06385 [Deltaproteobacteria bacterium]|nr:MAG: hypothetical protein D6705_06385 [Deltaproteobacteria bacterium]
MPRQGLRTVLLFGPAAVWLAIAGGLAVAAAFDPVPAVRDEGGVSPETCARCHQREHTTWHASYHRTMTQPAGPTAATLVRTKSPAGPADRVLAPFAGERFDALGFRATMSKSAAGVPHVRIEAIDGDGRPTGRVLVDDDVALFVGSHRYQQLVVARPAAVGTVGVRLPVAFDPDLGRWLHLNAAFLEPDGAFGNEADYLRHATAYNDNCLFCHNTAPAPGRVTDAGFRSSAEGLGITCEACHGGARAHVEAMADPLRRVAATVSRAAADGGLFVPDAATGRRGSDVCGRCHGQRIAADIGHVLRHGDGFVPGEVLADVSRPIFRDSSLAGRPDVDFRGRFWSDGTPRLSAYEYQGLLTSPCAADPSFGCATCHTMHGDDPDDQLRPGVRDGAVCTSCHGTLVDETPNHALHRDAEATCLDCHMPRVTYGLFRTMRTHRVVPPVTDAGPDDGGPARPPACLSCHVSADVEALARWGDPSVHATEGSVADACPSGVPYVVCLAIGGDPIERAVAVDLIAAADRPDVTAALADVLDDPYPALRSMAMRGLRRLALRRQDRVLAAALAAFEPMAEASARATTVEAVRRRLGPSPLVGRPEARGRLAEARRRTDIWIGE